MITKNYYRVLAYLFTRKDNEIRIKNYLGNDKTIPNSSTIFSLAWGLDKNDAFTASMRYLRSSLGDSSGVILGDGDTPPTPDDYRLAGEIITDFTYSGSLTHVVSDTAITAKAIYTITNTSDTEITIKEVGLMGANFASQLTGAQRFLLERTVLDTPVTIPAGGVGQVEYTVTFNYPTATA